jgi:hypothetical protein
VKWFGKSWGAPVCDPDTHVAVPVGESCVHCDEQINMRDAGVILPYASPPPLEFFYHKNCWLSEVVGSLAQLHTCRCYGGDGGIPPGFTPRQAANAAVALFHQTNENA